jgi:hypothetical protein
MSKPFENLLDDTLKKKTGITKTKTPNDTKSKDDEILERE